MTAIKLNDAAVISFGGEVLEYSPDWRIHITQLEKFELVKGRKGKHTLSIESIFSDDDKEVKEVDENAVPR